MPSNSAKENTGRLRSFKNKSKDLDVSSQLPTAVQLAPMAKSWTHSLSFSLQDMRRRRNDVTVELRKVCGVKIAISKLPANTVSL